MPLRTLSDARSGILRRKKSLHLQHPVADADVGLIYWGRRGLFNLFAQSGHKYPQEATSLSQALPQISRVMKV